MNEDMSILEAIQAEYAQLPEFEKYDLSLELLHGGSVKSVITKGKIRFERTIRPHEDISFLKYTFSYPNTFTPNSKMDYDSIKSAHFDEFGNLVTVREDCTEKFKVTSAHREEVSSLLKAKLGDRFNKTVK